MILHTRNFRESIMGVFILSALSRKRLAPHIGARNSIYQYKQTICQIQIFQKNIFLPVFRLTPREVTGIWKNKDFFLVLQDESYSSTHHHVFHCFTGNSATSALRLHGTGFHQGKIYHRCSAACASEDRRS